MNDVSNRQRKTRENRGQRKPRKVSASSLENAALYYLEKYATSSENLRRVLMQRVHRSSEHHGTDIDEGATLVDDLIRRFLKSGLLDDAVYANAQTQSMNRRGKSFRDIRAKLRQKGVATDFIESAFSILAEEMSEPDLVAALAYARRRRFGPYRTGAESDAIYQKELAAMARAGFSYGIARQVIDMKDVKPR